MTRYYFLLLSSLLFFTVACSSDDAPGSAPDTTEIIENDTQNFAVKIEGAEIPIYTWVARKKAESLIIKGIAYDRTEFVLNLTEKGVLVEAQYLNTDLKLNLAPYESSFFASSESFSISDFQFDEQKKIVSFSFEGKLFNDAFDISSKSIAIEDGRVSVFYIDEYLDSSKFMINAIIGNSNFESVKYWPTTEGNNNTNVNYGLNDGAEVLGIRYDPQNVAEGTYTFSDNESKYGINFEHRNPFGEEKKYTTSGVLTIEKAVRGGGIFLFRSIEGSFEAVATDVETGEQIQITNGRFYQEF